MVLRDFAAVLSHCSRQISGFSLQFSYLLAKASLLLNDVDE
jgi:hypothetical protein